MIPGPPVPQEILSQGWHTENKGENRTWWDFELRRELNKLTDFIRAIPSRIVQEPLKMEDENGWKRLEKQLLARLARSGLANLHELGL